MQGISTPSGINTAAWNFLFSPKTYKQLKTEGRLQEFLNDIDTVIAISEDPYYEQFVYSDDADARAVNSPADYYHWKDLQIAKEAARARKKTVSKRRRAAFNTHRDALELALIERDKVYRCSHPGCMVCVDLTIDHIIPLSKGGTDDISNLRLMCVQHNSSKGDSMPSDQAPSI